MTSINKTTTLLFFLTFTLLNGLAQAQTTYNWDGSENNNWDKGGNWFGASGWPDDPNHNAKFDSANYGTNKTDVDTRGGTFDILNLQMGQADELLTFRSSTSNPGMIRIHGNMNFNNNLLIDPGAHVFSTNLEVVNASTWTAGAAHTVNIQGVLSGSGTLTATANAAGAGTLHSGWESANTFSGTLIIDNVILDIEHRNAFQNAGVVINFDNGFKIDSSLSNQTINIGSLSGTGLLDFKSNNFVTTTSADTIFSGTLQSTGDNASTRNFTKAGTGTLTLAGNITNFGTLFNTDGGEVEITSGGDWQRLETNSGLVDIRNGANVVLESNGTNVFFMNGGGNAFIREGADVTLTGGSTPRVVQTGTSLINVNGVGSTLTAPRISVGPSGGGNPLFSVQSGGAVTVPDFEIGDLGTDNGSVSTASVSGGGTVDADLITLYLRGSLWVNGGQVTTDQLVANGSTEKIRISDDTPGAALVIGGGGSSSTFNNVIEDNAGGAGSIRKEGAGTLTLGGANTFTGGITINGGTLGLAHNNAAGTGAITVLGSTIDYAAGVNIANVIDLQNDATLNVSTGSATQSGSIFGGSASITKTGAGSLVFSGSNTYDGDTNIDAGSVILGNTNALQNSTVRVNVNDGLGLSETTATLGGLSGSGNLSIDNRTLSIGNNNASATYAGVMSGAGSLVKIGTGRLTLTGANTYSSGTFFNDGNIQATTDANLGASTGPLTFDGGNLRWLSSFNLDPARVITLSAGGGTLRTNIFDTTISQTIAGTGKLTKLGVGSTLTLTGASTYTGGTAVDHGTLQIGNGGTTGSIAGDVIIGSSASLVFNRSNNLAFPGAISGAGSLTKLGAGTLALTGANTYSGGTTIDAGTLLANNTTGSGNVIVNSGATLGGTGFIAGNVTVNAGGTVAPGVSPGTLTVEDTVFNTDSIFNVEIGGLVAGSEYDVLAVGGSADLAGILDIDLFDLGGGLFSPSLSDSFQILTTSADSRSGMFDSILGADLGGGLMFDVLYGASDVTLEVVSALPGDFDNDLDVDGADFLAWQRGFGSSYDANDLIDWEANYGTVAPLATTSTAVPEPTTGIMLMLGMVVMLVGRQKARSKLNYA